LITFENNASEDTGINLVDPVTGSSRSLFFGKDWGGAYRIPDGNRWTIWSILRQATGLVGAVAIDPAAGVVYARTSETDTSSSLLIIDGTTHAVTGTIPLDFRAGLIEVDGATVNVYISDGADGGDGTLTGPIRDFSN
jgi:hypothetical protein